ncbi:MAG: hypothetical protein AB7F23_09055 [Phycisphaerae bacterium]
MEPKNTNIKKQFVVLPIAALVLAFTLAAAVYAQSQNNPYNTAAAFANSRLIGCFIAMVVIVSFTELKIVDRLRMIIASLAGMTCFGVLMWPLCSGNTGQEPISLATGSFSPLSAILVVMTAFLLGSAGFLIGGCKRSTYGNLASLAGLSVWAIRTVPLADSLMYADDAAGRFHLYTAYRWEVFFWLIVVLAGHFGSRFTAMMIAGKVEVPRESCLNKFKWFDYAFIVPVGIAALIGFIGASLLVVGIQLPFAMFGFKQEGFLSLQPSQQQIAFGLILAFGIGGYLVRRKCKACIEQIYLAVAVLAFCCYVFLAGKGKIEALSANFSPEYFASPLAAILPIQFVVFGSLGAWAGWFMAGFESLTKKGAARTKTQKEATAKQ